MSHPQRIQNMTAVTCAWLALLPLLGGCAAGVSDRTWVVESPQPPAVELEGDGRFRLNLWRGADVPAWNVLSIRNSGPVSVDRIRMWDFGDQSLLIIDEAWGEEPQPFSLLPGEQLVLTETVDPATGIFTLTGVFFWDWPPATDVPAWPGRSIQMTDGSERGFQLAAGPEQGFAEVTLDSPLPVSGLRVGWQAGPTGLTLAPFVSTNMRVWARPGTYRHVVQLDRPADLSDPIRGQRRFGLRIAADAPEGRAGAVVISKLRIEREFKVIGKLADWRPGEQTFRVDLEGSPQSRLALRLDAY